MKEITLSDFVGDQIREREAARRGEHESQMSAHRKRESAAAKRHRIRSEKYHEDRAKREDKLRKTPFPLILYVCVGFAVFVALLLWRTSGEFYIDSSAPAIWGFVGVGVLVGFLTRFIFRWLYLGSPPKRERFSAPVQRQAGDNESILKAGQEGEDRLAEAFRRDLGDEWTLLKGYKNPGGEIDQILVGPPGVIAIEIKNYTGRVHIDGDRWTRDRYDNYGNLVGSGEPMVDGGGRSPSDQVNASADRLQWFLDSQSSGAGRVSRAVVLTHDKAELGRMSNPSVDYALTLNAIRRRGRNSDMLRRPARFDRQGAQQIVNLIERDHRYHANGGGKRRGGGKGTRPQNQRRRAG